MNRIFTTSIDGSYSEDWSTMTLWQVWHFEIEPHPPSLYVLFLDVDEWGYQSLDDVDGEMYSGFTTYGDAFFAVKEQYQKDIEKRLAKR